MGNGSFFQMTQCCNTKGDIGKGSFNLSQNFFSNILSPEQKKCETFKGGTNIIKNDRKVTKTISKLSSQSGSPIELKEIKIRQPEFDPKIYPTLELTGELFSEQKLYININGIKNSLRHKKDGTSFFGLKDNNDYAGTHLCDYLLDSKKIDINNNDSTITGRVFKIYYNRKEKCYILYFIHNTLILYYKIDNIVFLELDKDYYIILGDIFMTINIKKSVSQDKKINIQVEIENEKPKKYNYYQKDMPIKIGRMNCHINIPKASISKFHSIIDYSEDSFFYKDNNSTNGSSLLIKEDDFIRIRGDMSFKLEDIPFKIKEIPPQKLSSS